MSRENVLEKLVSALDVHVAPFALCAVSSGWCLDLPGPSEVMLHFVLEGRGELRGSNAESFRLEPCTLAVVPPGVVHELVLAGATKHGREIEEGPPPERLRRITAGSFDEAELVVACGLVRVRFGESLGLFEHLREILLVDLSDVPQVNTAFHGILAEQSSPAFGSETVTAALMQQCLVWLLRKLDVETAGPLPWLAALEDERLARSIDRMMEDLAANHTVESLAETAGMSRSAFSQRFALAFNRTPMNLLHHMRMQRAGRLLRRGTLSIDDVAKKVGISSRSHFSQSFKQHTGVSPGAYARQ